MEAARNAFAGAWRIALSDESTPPETPAPSPDTPPASGVPSPSGAVAPPSRIRRARRAIFRATLAFGCTVALILLLVGIGRAMGYRFSLRGNFVPGVDFTPQDEVFARVERDRAASPGDDGSAQSEIDAAELERLRALPRWPAYRGPRRDGVVDEPGLLASWPEGGPRELWRRPVGFGWGSFAIGLGRAWTLEQRRDREALVCYRLEDGAELWTATRDAHFEEPLGGEGPRSTPTLEGERIYSLGAKGDLLCVDALRGEILWDANIQTSQPLDFALAGSPLIDEGRAYVTSSGKGNAESLFAFDATTGERLLQAVPRQNGYASLVMTELGGRRQLLDFAADGPMGVDPATGEILWRFEWIVTNGINAAQPILLEGDRVFISSGYGVGAAMLRIVAKGGGFEVETLWRNREMKNKFSSSIRKGDTIYGLDEGILVALDVETGKRVWKKGRIGHGQMLLVGENLVVISESGELSMVPATRDGYLPLGSVQSLTSKTWNVPAIADGHLLVRNDREMACYDFRAR